MFERLFRLMRSKVPGRKMAEAAMVAVGTRPDEELANHRVVHPAREAGNPLPD